LDPPEPDLLFLLQPVDVVDWCMRHWYTLACQSSNCPHATEHTPEYCNGYAKGYTYEWNTLLSTTQSQSEPSAIQTQPQNTTTPTGPTYENTTYGIRVQYPSDWTVEGSNASGTLINIATFVSPTGPNSNPTADVSIYMDKLHNSTTTLNNYAHFVASTDYENSNSYYHAFKLELSTNSSILAGKPAYTLIGTYQDRSAGLQKVMEIGTIIGDKAYSVQYIADAPKYSSYFPAAQKIIGSLVIENPTG
jgi:hypothetical protein